MSCETTAWCQVTASSGSKKPSGGCSELWQLHFHSVMSRRYFSRAFFSPSCQGVFLYFRSNICHIFLEDPLPHCSLELLIFRCISLQLLVWYLKKSQSAPPSTHSAPCDFLYAMWPVKYLLEGINYLYLQKFYLNNNCPIIYIKHVAISVSCYTSVLQFLSTCSFYHEGLSGRKPPDRTPSEQTSPTCWCPLLYNSEPLQTERVRSWTLQLTVRSGALPPPPPLPLPHLPPPAPPPTASLRVLKETGAAASLFLYFCAVWI